MAARACARRCGCFAQNAFSSFEGWPDLQSGGGQVACGCTHSVGGISAAKQSLKHWQTGPETAAKTYFCTCQLTAGADSPLLLDVQLLWKEHRVQCHGESAGSGSPAAAAGALGAAARPRRCQLVFVAL